MDRTFKGIGHSLSAGTDPGNRVDAAAVHDSLLHRPGQVDVDGEQPAAHRGRHFDHRDQLSPAAAARHRGAVRHARMVLAGAQAGSRSRHGVERRRRRPTAIRCATSPWARRRTSPAPTTSRAGSQYSWGTYRLRYDTNGQLIQQYRSGVPDSVIVRNYPVELENRLNYDLGVYVQDSWKVNRLTVNPGVRFDWLNSKAEATNVGGGRFVGERTFSEITNVPSWFDVSPRIGVAYDVFGDGRTALKFSAGKYLRPAHHRLRRAVQPDGAGVDDDSVARSRRAGPEPGDQRRRHRAEQRDRSDSAAGQFRRAAAWPVRSRYRARVQRRDDGQRAAPAAQQSLGQRRLVPALVPQHHRNLQHELDCRRLPAGADRQPLQPGTDHRLHVEQRVAAVTGGQSDDQFDQHAGLQRVRSSPASCGCRAGRP